MNVLHERSPFRPPFLIINYIDDMRNQTENRLFEPQFFHYPWAFSIRFISSPSVLKQFESRIKKLSRKRNKKYTSIKAYILKEKGGKIKKDYKSEDKFCERYLKYQNEIINFVKKLTK